MELYILAPLRWFKCQISTSHSCTGYPTCAKYGQKDSDHSEDECQDEIKCTNCQENNLAYSWTCEYWKKEKIIEVKYKRNPLKKQKKKKVIEEYMRGPSYSRIVDTAGPNNSE